MQEYETICKHVGKIVLDFKFEMERVVSNCQKTIEDMKKVLEEKNTRIKQLEEELAKTKK